MTATFRKNFVADPSDPITYEVGVDETLHPDLDVTLRLREVGMSKCKYGCKIYADPLSALRVLAHNRNYGCNRIIPISERTLS
jgi:hypothetical protein